ncbi:sugar transferase [Lactococcus piscium]|uniref:Sugar transferase n=1 Tax=Pseudolactococcus paracarnosus TaxID=2749962 RepID=A0A7L4WEM8_9LACT|nr:sugar transferase [Lactococcus paracarnosus]MCJ1993300.1 sugar transferase [Lactococcus paracarnosus]QDJ28677.1 sugar transferase [Lactococcus paracarnosus]SPC37272.1 EpsD [Lactococcus piscium]
MENVSKSNINVIEQKQKQKQNVPFKKFSLLERVIKRSLDIIGGLIGSCLFGIGVVFLFIPYQICSQKDRGPMFYKQKRYGKNGQIFHILKFRTMIVDAEHYLEQHPEVKAEYHANGNKLEKDPRVTKLGGFIRRYSIDELPQFVNVLKGDMALVGPRPILLFEAKEYGERLHYLHMCKPGITGYWTTHGRSKVLFPERADLELYYLEYHSTRHDIKLLALTIGQMFKGSDAY